jgi:AcrR family transcriptional regulator
VVPESEPRQVADVIETGANGRLLIGDVRRAQIIRAVRRIIATDGFTAVTIARIAEELGTSRGVVNHHFRNKEQILTEVLQQAVSDANRATDAAVTGATDISRLTQMVAELASSESDWWPLYVAFLAEARTSQDGVYHDAVMEADRTHRKHLTRALGDEGKATVVLALMKGLALQRLVDAEVDLAGAVEAATGLLQQWEHGEES